MVIFGTFWLTFSDTFAYKGQMWVISWFQGFPRVEPQGGETHVRCDRGFGKFMTILHIREIYDHD